MSNECNRSSKVSAVYVYKIDRKKIKEIQQLPLGEQSAAYMNETIAGLTKKKDKPAKN